MILGITGGTGCGKTTALSCFSELGGTVIDCDAVYHRLLREDQALLAAIDNRFPGVVTDGLDRKKLGNIVFSDEKALSDLNAITHSAVRRAVEQSLRPNSGHIAIDAIALFESGLARLCDVTVAVTAPENSRIQRLVRREGITEQYAAARIAAQRPQSDFVRLCDHHIANDTTCEQFRQKCLNLFYTLGL